MIKLRDSGIVPKIQPDTGVVNWVDEHTEAIVTYALCGFANFGSVGIMLGGLGTWIFTNCWFTKRSNTIFKKY